MEKKVLHIQLADDLYEIYVERSEASRVIITNILCFYGSSPGRQVEWDALNDETKNAIVRKVRGSF